MAEARATDLPVLDREIGAELARIEAAVEGGSTELGALGFWRIVARVKTDRILIDRHADTIGRIDATVFRAAVRPRFPVWLGNAALLLVVVASGVLVGVAGAVPTPEWKSVCLVAAGIGWAIGCTARRTGSSGGSWGSASSPTRSGARRRRGPA